LSVIEKLKSINKDIKFSSDFIIGYPEETEEDFQETIELIKKVEFFNSYSYIFSPRSGTPAAEKQLNNLEESKKRLKKVQDIIGNFQIKNNKKFVQKYCEVLIENKLDGKDQYFGRTQFMTPVIFQSNNCKLGELVNVKITFFSQNNLFGVHYRNKAQAA
jgi:tRNA-2-methylthio-N6-dimethylallyladenosine synthase